MQKMLQLDLNWQKNVLQVSMSTPIVQITFQVTSKLIKIRNEDSPFSRVGWQLATYSLPNWLSKVQIEEEKTEHKSNQVSIRGI